MAGKQRTCGVMLRGAVAGAAAPTAFVVYTGLDPARITVAQMSAARPRCARLGA